MYQTLLNPNSSRLDTVELVWKYVIKSYKKPCKKETEQGRNRSCPKMVNVKLCLFHISLMLMAAVPVQVLRYKTLFVVSGKDLWIDIHFSPLIKSLLWSFVVSLILCHTTFFQSHTGLGKNTLSFFLLIHLAVSNRLYLLRNFDYLIFICVRNQ